jgi:pyruvate dehydrogenase E1 component alpha subunit/2-oxoisovalerate dehydrogenase E1 component alpha subunit
MARAKADARAAKRPARKRKAPAGALPRPPRRAPPDAHAAMVSVLRDDGSADRTRMPALADERLVWLYRQMVLIREFDRRMLLLQRQGRIGFYGPILGQEAATIGSAAAAKEQDWIFPALREGGIAALRGLPLAEVVAQLIGNAADRCKGRQMPCHYTWRRGRYVSMSSVIGTQISHAVGAAIAARIRGDDAVVLGYLGDGATSANDFHAGMNFAGVFQAPVVLFCQNNHWAISVPLSAQSASETIAIKGVAYGIRSVRVDGNDVLAVHAVTQDAIERARRGEGPTFVEAVTYRRLGHSSSDDPSRYRDEAEVRAWEQRDPIERYRRFLERRRLWDAARDEALRDEIARDVNAAIAEAEAHPPRPPAASLIEDVFAGVDPRLQAEFDAAFAGTADSRQPSEHP